MAAQADYSLRAQIIVDMPRIDEIKRKLRDLTKASEGAAESVVDAATGALAPAAAPVVSVTKAKEALTEVAEAAADLPKAIAPGAVSSRILSAFRPVLGDGAVDKALKTQGQVLSGLTSALMPAAMRSGLLGAFAPLLPGGAIALAIAGTLAGVAALTAGVAGLARAAIATGSQTEETRNRLAVLLSQGLDIPLDEGVRLAEGSFSRLTDQARALPGSLQDAVGAMQALSQASLLAGASLGEVERLSGLAVVAGSVAGGDPVSAGSQIRKAIEESATSGETPLVVSTLLAAGVGRDEFNALAAEQRFRVLMDAFERYGAAIELAERTWEARWSGLMDTVSGLWTSMLEPTFEVLKDAVGRVGGALEGEGLPRAVAAVGEVLGALALPALWAGQALEATSDVLSRFRPMLDLVSDQVASLGDGMVSLGREVGDTLGELAPLLGEILEPAVYVAGGALWAVVGTMDMVVKALRLMRLAVHMTVRALQEATQWIKGWLTSPLSGAAPGGLRLGVLGEELTTGLRAIFTRERKDREAAAEDADRRREAEARDRNHLKIELKLDQRVEWGDDRSMVAGTERVLTEIAERAARWGAESAYGMPRYA